MSGIEKDFGKIEKDEWRGLAHSVPRVVIFVSRAFCSTDCEEEKLFVVL